MLEFICYPKCSTCQKAQKWLDANGLAYRVRDIKTAPPSEEELRAWQAASGLPLRKFFNTSGKLQEMDDSRQLALLASDGMLVKRPLLIGGTGAAPAVLVGFREAEWQQLL